MVLSSVVLSFAAGVGKEDAVDMVGIETLEIMVDDDFADELILVIVDEGA